MGDGADMALEDSMNAEDQALEYRLGYMSHDKAYELGIIDELGGEGYRGKVHYKTCKFCGQKALHWQKVKGGKWRLHGKDNKVHTCKHYGRAHGKKN